MSERLRKAYLKRYESELAARVREKNQVHTQRMHQAGLVYNLRNEVPNTVCRKCGESLELKFIITPGLIHFGKLVCLGDKCKIYGGAGAFVRWIPYPQSLVPLLTLAKAKQLVSKAIWSYK